MNKLNSSLPELLNMLKTAESHIKKDKAPLLLVDGISKKKAGKKGSKRRLNPKGGINKRKKGKKTSGQSTASTAARQVIGKGIARLILQQ